MSFEKKKNIVNDKAKYEFMQDFGISPRESSGIHKVKKDKKEK